MIELEAMWQATPMTAALVATRVAALTMTAPLLGRRAMSWRVRLALTAAITLLIVPTQAAPSTAPPWGLAAAWVFREAVVGLGLGLAVMLLMAGVRAAGELAAQSAGLHGGGAMSVDAAEGEPLSRMIELTTVALLLASGGHRLVIDALLDTFRWLPVGSGRALPLRGLIDLAAVSFDFALRAAAPIVAAAIAARVLMSVLARAQPTLRNVGAGQSTAALAAVGIWLVTLGAAGLLASDQLQLLLARVRQLLQVG